MTQDTNSSHNKPLDTLIDGYHRFRTAGWSNNRERWASLKEGQEPEVMVIACSDSRVDPSQIFDVDPGSLFIVRNIAALVPPFQKSHGLHGVSAALEFAIQFLKVKEVMVLGHGMCGGCQAALTQSMRGHKPGDGGFVADWIGQLDKVRDPIAEKLGTKGRTAERAMELAAVRQSLANLRTFPCVQEKEANETLALRGAYFAISDGKLHLLDETTDEFVPVE